MYYRRSGPRLEDHDVVLTTYGVLGSEYAAQNSSDGASAPPPKAQLKALAAPLSRHVITAFPPRDHHMTAVWSSLAVRCMYRIHVPEACTMGMHHGRAPWACTMGTCHRHSPFLSPSLARLLRSRSAGGEWC